MGSRKRSARARERAAFEASWNGMDDAFAREEQREHALDAQRDEALRKKACLSKNRYDTRADAEAARLRCAEHASPNLHIYRCPYCGGWHLTHKAPRSRKAD